jgi:hypothetical protein
MDLMGSRDRVPAAGFGSWPTALPQFRAGDVAQPYSRELLAAAEASGG